MAAVLSIRETTITILNDITVPQLRSCIIFIPYQKVWSFKNRKRLAYHIPFDLYKKLITVFIQNTKIEYKKEEDIFKY